MSCFEQLSHISVQLLLWGLLLFSVVKRVRHKGTETSGLDLLGDLYENTDLVVRAQPGSIHATYLRHHHIHHRYQKKKRTLALADQLIGNLLCVAAAL